MTALVRQVKPRLAARAAAHPALHLTAAHYGKAFPEARAAMKKLPVNQVLCGDCRDLLRLFPDDCVDLIVTSPPYADSRSATYGGERPDRYVAWFLERSAEFQRVLKPDGTFILNIKERAEHGERHTYVIELILALRQQGWLWTEEFIWHKRNCHPGRWPNRFRDAWERCLQFNKTRQFAMYQDAVRVPIGDWAKSRLKNLSDTDRQRDPSRVKSGFGKRVANWVGKSLVYPTNVLHLATECNNRQHSATFPQELPAWFIKLFTAEGGVVLDPFVGSGTALIAARDLHRRYIGIDIDPEFCELARHDLEPKPRDGQPDLFAADAPN
jgi:DNA modification methylase